VSATIRRHHIVDLVIGNGCPLAVHLDLVMVANPAALRRATVIEVAAGALAVVSVQPRVKLHMPLFVVHPVISFLRYRAYTQQYGDHADYRYPPFGGHFDQFGGRDRARLRLYLSPFSALFLCRPGASRAMTPALSRLAPSKTCSSAPNICSLRSHQFAPVEDVAANEVARDLPGDGALLRWGDKRQGIDELDAPERPLNELAGDPLRDRPPPGRPAEIGRGFAAHAAVRAEREHRHVPAPGRDRFLCGA
jgi:hypothetical protein